MSNIIGNNQDYTQFCHNSVITIFVASRTWDKCVFFADI